MKFHRFRGNKSGTDGFHRDAKSVGFDSERLGQADNACLRRTWEGCSHTPIRPATEETYPERNTVQGRNYRRTEVTAVRGVDLCRPDDTGRLQSPDQVRSN